MGKLGERKRGSSYHGGLVLGVTAGGRLWGGAQVLMVLLDEGGVSREVLRRLEDRELVGHGWQAREGGAGATVPRMQALPLSFSLTPSGVSVCPLLDLSLGQFPLNFPVRIKAFIIDGKPDCQVGGTPVVDASDE